VQSQSSVDQLRPNKRKADNEAGLFDATKPASVTLIASSAPTVSIAAIPATVPPKCRVSQSSVDPQRMGLRTTTDVRPGEVIITEKPIIEVDFPPPKTQIARRYRELSAPKRRLFHSFKAKSSDEVDNTIFDIIANNVVPLGGSGEDGEPTRSGMFRHICRINHSCLPNARWTWLEETGMMGE
jgi:hypothetical protein